MKQPFDISIGQRLAISFGVLLLVLGMFVGFVFNTQGRSERVQTTLSDSVLPTGALGDLLKRDLYKVAVELRAYLRVASVERLERFRAAVDEARGALRDLRERPKAEDGEALYRKLEPLAQEYLRGANRLAEQRAARAVGIAEEEDLALVRIAAVEAAREFTGLYESKLREGLDAMAAARDRVASDLTLATAVIALLFVLIGHLAAQSIRRPARQLVQVAGALQAGDWQPALAWAPRPNGDAHESTPVRNEMYRLGQAFGAAAVALESREQRMRATAEVLTATVSSLKKEEIARAALPVIVGHVGAEIGVIYRRDPSTDVLRPIAQYAYDASIAPLALGEGLPGQAARERRAIVLRKIPPDSGFAVKLGYDQAPPKTVAAIPIVFGDELRGVLLVASLRDIDDNALAFLRSAGAQLGIGFKNAYAHQETERLLAEVRDRNERIQAQNEELQAQNEEIQAQSEEIQAQSEEIQAQNEEIQTQNEDLKQQAEDLRSHAKMLAEAGNRKSEFLGVLAHELRNPLAAITNSLIIAKRTPPGSEHSIRAQAVIERQAQQLIRLIDDLLDITRISQGKIQMQRDRFDMVEMIRSCVEDHRGALEANDLALEVELPDTEVWIEGDRTRLCQVFGNLLHNAIKFSDKGESVGVSLQVDRAAGEAALHVIDSGIGIDAPLLSLLFQPFHQGVSGRDRANTGLGLGLALVKELTELHGGSVEARSDGPGTGAEFIVRLPLLDASGPEAPSETVATREPFAARRILIIEDNRDVAHSLRDVLALEGHQVRIARSGAEGLKRAPALRPHVILCDIGLPDMDGYEVVRRLRADDRLRDVFTVALTGYASHGDKERASQAGFDAHVAKPPSIERIREVLAALDSG